MLSAQEFDEQTGDLLRLLLLHPVPGTVKRWKPTIREQALVLIRSTARGV